METFDLEYTNEITLELNTLSAPVIIGAKQYDDNTRSIVVSYTKNGQDYKINRNNIVRLRMRKPDNTVVFNDVEVYYNNDNENDSKNGTVVVNFSAQCLSAAGRAYADLMEFDLAGKILSTASFIIDIQPAPDISNQTISTNEFQSFINFVHQADSKIEEAREWANGGTQGVPSSTNNAKYWSQQANIWANGGTQGTPSSTNNAKYWANKATENGAYQVSQARNQAENAQRSAENATQAASEAWKNAEAWANGTRGTIPIPSTDAAYMKNAKYWSEQAENIRNEIWATEVSVTMLNDIDASAQVRPTLVSATDTKPSHMKFEFEIPKSNPVFCAFDIELDTGYLVMICPDYETGMEKLTFEVDEETGQLGVIFNE